MPGAISWGIFMTVVCGYSWGRAPLGVDMEGERGGETAHTLNLSPHPLGNQAYMRL